MGAGVIPFCVSGDKINFLFQKIFSGRKTGYLIDFGGGLGEGEDFRTTAIREFIEETETLYFTDDLHNAYRSLERVKQQTPIVENLFDKTLTVHPEWCCKRITVNPEKSKQWKTFFIEFPYRNVEALNYEWQEDKQKRFKKRRELVWVEADELLAIYENTPERLWKRVRQLDGADKVVDLIKKTKFQS